jgi:hypothetical protein
MTIQVKSTLIIIATFLLGILIGFFGDRWTKRPPPFNAQEMRRPDGFIQFNEKLIQPTADQKEAVHAILAKYYKRFNRADGRHRQELTALVDSMHVELSPILTREQRERILQRRPGKDFGNGRMPFPPGGPGGLGGRRGPSPDFNKPNDFSQPPEGEVPPPPEPAREQPDPARP